jgi:hypothetical protein
MQILKEAARALPNLKSHSPTAPSHQQPPPIPASAKKSPDPDELLVESKKYAQSSKVGLIAVGEPEQEALIQRN